MQQNQGYGSRANFNNNNQGGYGNNNQQYGSNRNFNNNPNNGPNNGGGPVYGGSQRNFNQPQQGNYGRVGPNNYNNGPQQNNNYNPNPSPNPNQSQYGGSQRNFNNNNNYGQGQGQGQGQQQQQQQQQAQYQAAPKKEPLMTYNSLQAGPPPGKKMWSKKKKRITNPSQKFARMEIEWNIVTDFGNEGHHILLKHIQDPDTDITERYLYLDGEEVVNETTNERKFELDIGEDEIDVVIMHNEELTRYDYFIYINDVEYADKNSPHSKRTGGMKQTLRSKDISAKELKKKDKKRWEERNQLKVKEEKDKKRKVRKKAKYKKEKPPKIDKDKKKKKDKNRNNDNKPKKEKKKWGFSMGSGKKKDKKKKDKKKER